MTLIHSVKHLPSSGVPRTTWQYNNLLYAAVGAVIERVNGKPLSEILRDWFWAPLGMSSTTLSLQDTQDSKDSSGNPRLARGYYWTHDQYYVPDEYPDFTPVAAAGAAISSVNDLALCMRALLRSSSSATASDSTPISSELFKDLTTPRSIVPAMYSSLWEHCTGVTTCALGWLVQNIGSRRLISHGGGLVGFGTCIYLLPEEGLGFLSMGNTMGTRNEVGTKLFLEVLRRLKLIDHAPERAFECSAPSSAQANQAASETGNIEATLPAVTPSGRAPDYTVSYSHPAYGTFTVVHAAASILTLVQTKFRPQGSTEGANDQIVLHVKPSHRTWPNVCVFTPNRTAAFDLAVFFQRGSERGYYSNKAGTAEDGRSLTCRNEVIMEYLYEAKAAFEIANDGVVARLGMELSPELADCELAKDGWKAGMIWLDKVA